MDLHVILLMQPEMDRRTRTYHDYETLPLCLDSTCFTNGRRGFGEWPRPQAAIFASFDGSIGAAPL